MVVATALVMVAGLADRGVAVVGLIPSGLPDLALPSASIADIRSLAGPAVALALLINADTILTVRSMAKLNDYEVDPDHEFFALGAANIGAGIAGGFSANGSQSRSFIKLAAGAKSQISNLVALLLVVLTLLVLTPLFENLPRGAGGSPPSRGRESRQCRRIAPYPYA